MKTTKLALAALAVVGGTAAATAADGKTNDWENLAVNSINRLPPRTYTMPLADEQAALTDALEPASPWKVDLNGSWKFSWSGNPELRTPEFWRTGFDDSAWFDIEVPGCVELSGWGSPGYTNVRYPHKLEWPKILDRQSGLADYNPVSQYRRSFTLPDGWMGRKVVLRFDGVYSAYYVWLNGKRVGYAEDSKLPSEFDVTPYLDFSSAGAKQTLCVEVYRWCDGSYLEDQDMTRYSGIFRDVTLWSMPKDGIWDFAVKTGLSSDRAAGRLSVVGIDGSWSGTLYDAEFKPVAGLSPLRETEIPEVKLWSAEKPYLYTLVLKKGEDVRMRRIGFKEQKIVGNAVLVNGRKIKFKGVNRHETSPDRGRSVTLDDMLADIRLMKRYNVNTVRTSHYPNHHLWYDLCDRYGIYVVAEANVEGHEPGYGEKGLGRFKEFDHSIVERNLRHVAFYRNHPSVTIWSMGNETGHGDCFRHAIAAVKGVDPTRPIHWERGNLDADVDSCMYPEVEWLEARGKLGDFGEATPALKWAGDPACENRHTAKKAFFLCEYAHAMGNAIGNFAEYWDVFYRYDSLSGGCIWDWVDQAVWKETGKIDRRTGKRDRFLSYGGDFDEEPNDGPFNCNGIVDPERNVTAKLVEVGHVYRNLVVTRSEVAGGNGFAVVFELWNRFGFTGADEFLCTWKLRENGTVTREGAFETPAVAPLSRCRFTVPGLADALAASSEGAELAIDFAFSTKKDELWAEKGWVVARDQVRLGGAWNYAARAAIAAVRPQVVQDEKTVTVTVGETKAVFCRRSGTLCELVMAHRTVLQDPLPGIVTGPRLTVMRALTDNDGWLRQKVYDSGLTQLRYHARPIVVTEDGVKTTVEVTGSKSAGFTHETTWRFAADGAMTMENRVIPHGTMPEALPRIGLSLRVAADLNGAEWYGRGPRENYVDRSTGSFLGIWKDSVDGLAEAYVRPQDNGSRTDVRWFRLFSGDEDCVEFAATEPMCVQALRCGWEDLEFARHRNRQQRFRAAVLNDRWINLNLDVRQLGLGGASCGPRPMAKYIFPIEPISWTMKITPVAMRGRK